jgi:hypothetical protein
MDAEWRHRLRVNLLDEQADVARTDPEAPAPRPLADILNAYST